MSDEACREAFTTYAKARGLTLMDSDPHPTHGYASIETDEAWHGFAAAWTARAGRGEGWNPSMGLFDEKALRSEIVRVWGEHGAHVEVFDRMLRSSREGCP